MCKTDDTPNLARNQAPPTMFRPSQGAEGSGWCGIPNLREQQLHKVLRVAVRPETRTHVRNMSDGRARDELHQQEFG